MTIPATAKDLRARCALTICYSDEEITPLLERAQTDLFGTLLSLPMQDTRHVLVGLLSHAARSKWARACADRARAYADRARAEGADAAAIYATHVTHAEAFAARAAAGEVNCTAAAVASFCAAAFAADFAAGAAAAEHRLAVEHGAHLLLQETAP